MVAVRLRSTPFSFAAVTAMVVAALMSGSASAVLANDEVELRIRFALGSGTAVAWQGRIWLDSGTIESSEPIGLDHDSVRSFRQVASAVTFAGTIPRSYEAIDVQVRAPLSTNVNVALTRSDHDAPIVVAIPLTKLITGRHVEKLDDSGNQLSVERVPGDRLHVDIQRPHLVFSPAEKWVIRVQPHQLGTSFPATATLHSRLFAARSETETWSDQRRLTVNGSGVVDREVELAIPIPEEEGVYDLELSVDRPRVRSLIPTSETVVRRRVQFVVVSDTDPQASEVTITDTKTNEGRWNPSPVLEFDPAQHKLFHRLANVSPLISLNPAQPRTFASRDLDVKATTVDRGGRAWTQLGDGGWQAYALPVHRSSHPHILEVEYPGDMFQTLGVSIMEPNSADKIVPLGVDGAIHVEQVDIETIHDEDSSATFQNRSSSFQTYRLIFWPRTKSPILVLTNRRSTPAAYGTIRLFEREGRLPSVPIDRSATNRFAVARFSRPIFPEVFGATDAVDSDAAAEPLGSNLAVNPTTETSLDDWVTFYEGASRLIEYVRYVGYDAISLTALCEGSAIFPTTDIPSTAKYDTGTYFSNGQDPVRKDVLELLFRMCDRSGLRLIPSFELSAPMRSLESIDTNNLPESAEKNGIYLSNGTDQLAVYNPLNPRVQTSMVDFVKRVTQRYAHHISFAGIGLTLAPGTATHLPGPNWGSDPHTLNRFVHSAALPADQKRRIAYEHQQMLYDASYRELWLKWRAQQLHTMYGNMAKAVRAERADATIYLTIEDLLDEPHFSDAMRPHLPSMNRFSHALLDMGIQTDRYLDDQDLVLLSPHRLDSIKPLVATRSQNQMNNAVDFGPWEDSRSSRASSFFHVPQTVRLPDVDRESPLGGKATFAFVAPQVLPNGPASRRHIVQSLALHDVRMWFDGGWSMIRDQHDSLAPLIDVFRRLPEAKFATAEIPTSLGDRFVVRTLSIGDLTYAYIVNNSPWETDAKLQLTMRADGKLNPLTPYRKPGTLEVGDQGVWWKCRLQPYDVVAGVFTSDHVQVERVLTELPGHVLPVLRNEIANLSGRISSLAKPSMRPIGDNAGFESNQISDSWISTQDADVQIELDQRVYRSGARSLRVTNRAPVAWLLSEPFAAPATGRLLLRVWAKHDGQSPAPRLLLLAENTVPTQSFVRQIEHAMPTDELPQWHPYDLWLDDLPQSLEKMRFGVEVLGSGTVWLDDVQTFDLAFSRGERNELSKIIALADLQLREGRVGDCRTTLDDYWMRYLTTYVPIIDSRVAQASSGQAPSSVSAVEKDMSRKSQDVEETRRPESSRALDRLKRFVPLFR